MPPKRESPLLLKSYETLVWLLRHTQKFPKSQRFVLAKRMEEAGLDRGRRPAIADPAWRGHDAGRSPATR